MHYSRIIFRSDREGRPDHPLAHPLLEPMARGVLPPRRRPRVAPVLPQSLPSQAFGQAMPKNGSAKPQSPACPRSTPPARHGQRLPASNGPLRRFKTPIPPPLRLAVRAGVGPAFAPDRAPPRVRRGDRLVAEPGRGSGRAPLPQRRNFRARARPVPVRGRRARAPSRRVGRPGPALRFPVGRPRAAPCCGRDVPRVPGSPARAAGSRVARMSRTAER